MSANWLQQAQLTTSGLPILLRGEVERIVVPDVKLKPDDPNPALSSGRLHLTSHRLIWIDQPSTSAFSIPLSSVLSAARFKKKSLTNLFHSPRVRLLIDRGSGSSIGVILVLRRKDELSESFFGRLMEVLRQRTWEVEEKDSGEETSSSRGWTRPVVGVAGILRKEQEAWENTDKSLQEAFQDLNALMCKAKDMVLLAEKMRQKLLSGSSNQVNTSTEEDASSKQEMQDWLLSVGIASPVTKESAGAMYHQQLSRQLADFVKVPLERNGGMIALIDIYCLFNRARGAELISPDDLLQACALWEKFDVPVLLREFDSGVKVIQSKNHSDEEVFSRISALVVKPEVIRKGISPSDAAITLGIAPALAKEQLLAAEKQGLLCRDVSPDGFRFHVNLLQEINPRDIYRVNNHGVYSLWISTAS